MGVRVLSSVGRASRRHREGRRIEACRTHHQPTRSSVAEQSLDKRSTLVRIPDGWTNTRGTHERLSQTSLWMLYRSGERPGLLTPLGFGPHRGFESHSILQIWTSYRSGRTGRTLNPMACAHRRFESCLVLHPSRLYPNGRGSGSRSRKVLVRVEPDAPVQCAVRHPVRPSPCHGDETGSTPVQRAICA